MLFWCSTLVKIAYIRKNIEWMSFALFRRFAVTAEHLAVFGDGAAALAPRCDVVGFHFLQLEFFAADFAGIAFHFFSVFWKNRFHPRDYGFVIQPKFIGVGVVLMVFAVQLVGYAAYL